jgi:hypothetical protein
VGVLYVVVWAWGISLLLVLIYVAWTFLASEFLEKDKDTE